MGKIAVKKHPWTNLTKEMVNWLIKHDKSLEDKEIDIHNPLFVQCVEELKPDEFRIFEFDGDEYLTLESSNDVLVLVPKDIEILKNSFVKIPEECKTKEKQEEQQDS